jgi:ABC-type dipeptide/oligopeptide/nickel transport system ATPase component
MLLSVRDLRSAFFLDEGELWAVDGISFDVDVGETVGLVGESGCGKTIVALSILDLIPYPGRVVSGRVSFEGRDLLSTRDWTSMMRSARPCRSSARWGSPSPRSGPGAIRSSFLEE